jgi:hypothetical protein
MEKGVWYRQTAMTRDVRNYLFLEKYLRRAVEPDHEIWNGKVGQPNQNVRMRSIAASPTNAPTPMNDLITRRAQIRTNTQFLAHHH